MNNKGTNIDHVIAYLQKRKAEGYTHVAIETPDRTYSSGIFYNEMSREDEGVLILGASFDKCHGCERFKLKMEGEIKND